MCKNVKCVTGLTELSQFLIVWLVYCQTKSTSPMMSFIDDPLWIRLSSRLNVRWLVLLWPLTLLLFLLNKDLLKC